MYIERQLIKKDKYKNTQRKFCPYEMFWYFRLLLQ